MSLDNTERVREERMLLRRQAKQEGNARRRADYIQQRGGACEACGQTYPDALIDFHHVDPLAKDGILKQAQWTGIKGMPMGRTWLEANKCAMLCANCHRLEHWVNRSGMTVLPEGYSTPDGSTTGNVP